VGTRGGLNAMAKRQSQAEVAKCETCSVVEFKKNLLQRGECYSLKVTTVFFLSEQYIVKILLGIMVTLCTDRALQTLIAYNLKLHWIIISCSIPVMRSKATCTRGSQVGTFVLV
jgi:hypothetical protein